MGKAKRTLGVILAALMLVVTCMTYVPASAAVVLPTVKFVGLQNIPAAVGEEQTLFLTSDYTGNVQYQVFYVQRNDPSKVATTTWTKLGDWTTAADAKTPVEVKVPKGTITVAGNYSFAIRVKRAGVTGQNSNTYGDFDSAYAFNYVFAATATEGLKAATLASAEVTVGEDFVISGLTAGNSYKLYTLNETRTNRWEAVATSNTNTIKYTTTAAGNYVLDLQLLDAAGKVTAVKLFNVKVNDAFKTISINATSATQLLVKFTKEVDETSAETVANYVIANGTPSSAVLQSDKKSVVLTMAAPITGTMLYVVNPIKLAADTTKTTPIFTYVETYTDTAAPYVLKTEYPTYDFAAVTFSEPIDNIGSVPVVTAVDASGNAVTTLPVSWSADKTVATFDLSAVAADKDVTVVLVGTKDMGGNLINPNPLTLTFKKVKADTTAPTVVEVKALSNVRVSVKFSEKLKTTAGTLVATVATKPVVFTTEDNITYTGTFGSTTGVAIFSLTAGYADMSNNAGAAYTKLLQLAQDTTAPTLASSEVKTFNSKQYVVLHFNEDVDPTTTTPVNLSGSYVKDYVTYSFTASKAVTPVAYAEANGADKDDSKSVMFDISNDTTFPTAAYTLSIPANFVYDLASTPNGNAALSVSVTKGTVTVADSSAPTVATGDALSSDNTTLTVTFSEDMDPATALNVNNYKVGGVSIFSSAIFDGAANKVALTITPGTVTYAGDRLITIAGVKDKAGNVMTAYSKVKNFAENVKPYIASAKLTAGNTIEVTMSEAVTGIVNNDIEVYVAGEKVTLTSTAYASGKATITLTSAITDLSKLIQVKLVDATVADNSLNTAVTGTLVTVGF